MRAQVDTVVFDLGGVLIEVDHNRAMQWLALNGCREADIGSFAERSGMHEHELGRLAGDAFYDRIAALLTVPVTMPEIHQWWTGFFAPDQDMLRLAKSLAGRYRVFILSNTGPLHWAQALQQFQLGVIARDCLTSFEAGVAKPDARIYALAGQRFALEPERTVFIDDLEPNVRAAQAAGWRGLVHRDFSATAGQLQRLGVRGRLSR